MPNIICRNKKIDNTKEWSEYGCISYKCPLIILENINNNFLEKECDEGVVFLEWTEFILYKHMFVADK